MLLYDSRLLKAPVMSLHTGASIGTLLSPIIDPNNLAIIAYYVNGPLLPNNQRILRTKDIREINKLGVIVDSIDELIDTTDVIKIDELIKLDFQLPRMRVKNTRKKTIGRVSGYSIDTDDFMVQQISVGPIGLKSFSSTSRLIHRSQIREINNTEIIVNDADIKLSDLEAEKRLSQTYVNPFRKQPRPQLDSSADTHS